MYLKINLYVMMLFFTHSQKLLVGHLCSCWDVNAVHKPHGKMVVNTFLLLVPGQRHTNLGVHIKTLLSKQNLKSVYYVVLFQLCFWHAMTMLTLTLAYKKLLWWWKVKRECYKWIWNSIRSNICKNLLMNGVKKI